MLRISLFLTIFAFLLFRPSNLDGNILYPDDDWSYFAHASSIAFGQFPSYSHEYWTTGKNLPAHPIGCGLLAAPFVAFFSLFDRLGGSDIITQRTADNIPDSWSVFGFCFATGVYFWCGCALLFLGLKEYFPKNIASWSVVLLVLFEGAPLYAYRRPVFSHIYSFFVLSLLVYLLMIFIKHKHPMRWGHVAAIGLASGLEILIREDNVFLGLAWPLVFACVCWPQAPLRRKLMVTAAMYAFIAALVLFFYAWPSHVAGHIPLFRGARLLQIYRPSVYLERVVHIVFGLDWGLVFTAPFLLAATVGLFWKIREEIMVPLRFLALLLAVNFWVIVQWMSQGGWYGYRYFIFTAFPLLAYPFAFILNYAVERCKRWAVLPVAAMASFPVLSMISFEAISPNLTLHNYILNGYSTWSNDYYQCQVWFSLIRSPWEYLVAIFRGGPFYIAYLITDLFQRTDILPAMVQLQYMFFQWDMLVKTLLVYITPLCLWAALASRDKNTKKTGRFEKAHKPCP